jgi:Phytanoyl-CoA dioxygenase (PhyH)
MGLEIRVDRLEEIGVGRSATLDEIRTLDEQGFVVIPELLTGAEVEVLISEFERLIATDAEARQHELGTRRTQAKADVDAFAICWRHRVVLDAAAHLLGATFQVGHVDLRDPAPGHGEQRLHPDHGPAPVAGITATWFLDAWSDTNGATRVLPGSHRSPPVSSQVPIPVTEHRIPVRLSRSACPDRFCCAIPGSSTPLVGTRPRGQGALP